MGFEFKGSVKWSLFSLVTLFVHMSLCSDDEELVETLQKNYNETKSTLGENCWRGKCPERQICNQIFKCECLPEFINRSNVCVPCAGENEECLTSSDCCGMLFCINGICRKAAPNAEFITLAKICLGITITSIIIALLSSLLKCLIRFDTFRRFRRCGNSESSDPTDTQGRHILESQLPQSGVVEEKPPSYEECMRSGRRSSLADSPPPYVIYGNDLTTNYQNYIFPVRNITEITSTNTSNIQTPLNAHALSQDRNAEESLSQKITAAQ